MRQLVLSPRWIKWHLLTLGAMVTCGLLAAWQWGRAGSAYGSALNVGYGLQWPLFAVFFGVMWWRMLRMEAARIAGGPVSGEHEISGPQGSGPVSGGPVSGGLVSGGPAEAAPGVPAPRAAANVSAGAPPAAGAPPSAGAPPAAGTPPSAGPSPFAPRPSAPAVTDDEDPELAAYNRMLSELSARDSGADPRHPDR